MRIISNKIFYRPAIVAQWANTLSCSAAGLQQWPWLAGWLAEHGFNSRCRHVEFVRFSACYEIKFSDRYRGSACVLYKM